MHLTLSRDTLATALADVTRIIERKPSLPILSTVALDAAEGTLTLLGSDLETEISTRIEGDIRTEGALAVPAHKLAQIAKDAPGDTITLKQSDTRLSVTAGRARWSLSHLPATDYPRQRTDIDWQHLPINGAALRRALGKVAFSMARNDVRYYLNGVLLELDTDTLTTVATDGHRLARHITPLDHATTITGQWLLPAKTVLTLLRQLDDQPVTLALGPGMLRLDQGDTQLGSKLIDGRYPDYARVIPAYDQPRRATLPVQPLRDALHRSGILANEKYQGVQLTFAESTLTLSTSNDAQEQASDQLDIDYPGEALTIGANLRYLTDVLTAIDTDTCTIDLHDDISSMLFRGDHAETYVVMPMKR